MDPHVSSDECVLECRGVCKDFPGVRALNNVNFTLRKGEVHAIIGENGAGKSTLIKILAGAQPCSEGEIYCKGQKVSLGTPRKGLDMGVSVIYQELTLVPYLSVAKNIFLGREPRRKWLPLLIDYPTLYRNAKAVLDSIGASIDVKTNAVTLGVAQAQLVEMAKAFSIDSPIIIMDEPTAALTRKEIGQLFQAIDQFKHRGISVIYISHRLEELLEIADRVTVLRDGNVVATMEVNEKLSIDEIIRLMVGRSMDAFFVREFSSEKGEMALEVDNLSRKGVIDRVSLQLRSGEIVGIAGLVGSGRTELARAIFGADPVDEGQIRIFGRSVKTSPIKSVALGVGFIPENRKTEGLSLILPIKENVIIASLKKLFPTGLLNPAVVSRRANEYVKALRIATPSILRVAKFLSGGNQQKVVVAKWLCTQAKIFIFDEPTRGVDVGAKAEIHQLMNELVKAGAAILMISSELPEVLNMSDRIYVMNSGRIVKELTREEANQESVLRYAMGIQAG